VKLSPFQLLKDILLAAVVISGGIYVLIAIGSMSSRPTSSTTAPPAATSFVTVPVGSEGRINNGSSVIPVAVDEELLPELKKAAGRSDLQGIGPVFYVTEDTEARVGESSLTGLRVRILTGSQKGRVGWVPTEWVKPIQ
jgi:hypothetical protein